MVWCGEFVCDVAFEWGAAYGVFGGPGGLAAKHMKKAPVTRATKE